MRGVESCTAAVTDPNAVAGGGGGAGVELPFSAWKIKRHSNLSRSSTNSEVSKKKFELFSFRKLEIEPAPSPPSLFYFLLT